MLKSHSDDLIGQSILRFIDQADTENLKTRGYPKSYGEYKIELSFGKGSPAKTPWFAFLKEGNLIYKGIYPIILFYKKERLLILAFGVSETMPSLEKWNLSKDYKLIQDYFKEKKYQMPKYGKSFLYMCYMVDELDIVDVLNDLHTTLQVYKTNT